MKKKDNLVEPNFNLVESDEIIWDRNWTSSGLVRRRLLQGGRKLIMVARVSHMWPKSDKNTGNGGNNPQNPLNNGNQPTHAQLLKSNERLLPNLPKARQAPTTYEMTEERQLKGMAELRR
ncbi:hypothetical protein GQ457_06G022550 [Hibiscus cannabinus]